MKKATLLIMISGMILCTGSTFVLHGQPYRSITRASADAMASAYRANPFWSTTALREFTVDLAQLEAMNALRDSQGNLYPSYRLYAGTDVSNNSQHVVLVVGVDGNGSDVAGDNQVLMTNRSLAGPCPPSCDATSSVPAAFTSDLLWETSNINAIRIELSQLNALNTIRDQDRNIQFFRIYYGYDRTNPTSRLSRVTGVDSGNRDMGSTVQNILLINGGPCPTLCDVNSPLN